MTREEKIAFISDIDGEALDQNIMNFSAYIESQKDFIGQEALMDAVETLEILRERKRGPNLMLILDQFRPGG